MKAITFTNTKTTIPQWVDNLHVSDPRSYAYEKDGYCISIYGRGSFLYTVATGLIASEASQLSIREWSKERFGAEKLQDMFLDVGEVITGVWRPGLFLDVEIEQALDIQPYQRISAEQSLYILIEKLYELFLYIEPSKTGLNSFSHKTRELLILACTEVESFWKQYMNIAGIKKSRFTTNDYVKLLKPLALPEYEIRLKPYNEIKVFRPFYKWSQTNPTASLKWFDAYNKTKHDRESFFSEATLKRCIEAVSANIAMFCVRYGPYVLYNGNGILSSHFNHIFEVKLNKPDVRTFYIPNIKCIGRRKDFVCGNAEKELWKKKPLVL